jgi:hypothetical protein
VYCCVVGLGGEEFHSVVDVFVAGFAVVKAVASVMFVSGSKIPSVGAVGYEGATDGGFFVHDDASARGCERGGIEIESSVKLSFGREPGVQAQLSEKIQGQQGLWNEPTPEVHGPILVSGAEAGNEVVLECADGAFGGVASVIVWGDKLVLNALLRHELFEAARGFVIQALQLGFEPPVDKVLMERRAGSNKVVFRAGAEGSS